MIKNLLIDTHTKNSIRDSFPRKKNRYYATESLKCPRALLFKRHEENPNKNLPFGLFTMGNAIETEFFKILDNQDVFSIEQQKRVKIKIDDFEVSGYADGVFTNNKTGKKTVVEIKSINSINRNTSLDDHYKAQTMCYMKGLNINSGCVIYIERGDLFKINEWYFDFSAKFWDIIENHFRKIHSAISGKIMPEPVPFLKWECRFCDYKNICGN